MRPADVQTACPARADARRHVERAATSSRRICLPTRRCAIALLLAVMGSPDPRQIDGARRRRSADQQGRDRDRSRRGPASTSTTCSLQVFVDEAVVDRRPNCGNMLAGVGPFAIERGLVPARDGETAGPIFMVNTGNRRGRASSRRRAGVPTLRRRCANRRRARHAAPIGSTFSTPPARRAARCCRPATRVDVVDGVACTLIDNGMPVVVLRARDVGTPGTRARESSMTIQALKARIEAIRLAGRPHDEPRRRGRRRSCRR